MKCPVCETNYDDNLEKCPVCGWEDYEALDKITMENRLKEIEEAKKHFFVSANITIVASKNTDYNGRLVSADFPVSLGNTRDIEPGEIQWADVQFARQPEDPLKLRVKFAFDNGKVKESVTEVPGPRLKYFWHVGLKCEKKGSYVICVGNATDYSVSRPFEIISLLNEA